MSVSMSNEPRDETADARGDLAVWLDDYTAGRCDRAQMQASFLEICRSNPEAPWDALALLDQYQRRGRVDPALARTLKSDIAQLVFGVVNQSEEQDEDETAARRSAAPTTDPAPASADTTGTRWRRMAAEQEPPAAPRRPSAAFVDPLKFVREAPYSRPMPPIQHPHTPDGTATSSVLRDRYELLTILGRGNAGTVYKALDRHRGHLEPAAQCVALRVLKKNYRDSSEALAELERQFHQAQSLSHPNIVSVFDLDRDGATYFLVMELLEGELLSGLLQRLDHHPIPREQALAIIGSIGAGLAHAHRRGVVHSDLRPGNVMIAANGEVKLLDTGFARRTQVDTHRPEPWIGEPVLGGRQPAVNLAYASEERVNGEPPEAGEDVYSLACIAYELLSGQHPFGGRSAPLARAQGRPPPRISGLTNRQWTALQTALKWSRAERKIDVVELIAALGCAEVPQRLLPPQMIAAAPKRRRFGAAGAVSLALLLIAGAAAAYWFNRDSLPQLAAPAQAPQETATEIVPPAASLPEAQPPVEAPAAVVESPPTAVTASPSPQVVPKPEPASAPAAARQEASPPANAGGTSRIAFDKDTYVATESDGSVKVTIRRSGSAAKAATFRWRLLPNSAEAGNDYAAIGPGTETIPAGLRSVTLTIPLVSDAVKESTELFLVELSDPENAELGDLARAAVIIVDDD